MSTEPKNWAAEFPNYPAFQRAQSADAAVTVEMNLTGLNDTLNQLVGLGELGQEALLSIALELLRRISMRTPVKTGRLRNSFHLVEPGQTDSYQYNNDLGQTFDGTLSEEGAPGPLEVLVGTNVLYALAIEAGHSRQAPQGMVAISVAEMQGALEAKLQALIDERTGGG
jgi:hypothetical protein